MTKATLFVVDDEPEMAAFIADVARDLGFEPETIHSGHAFKTRLNETCPDVIVMDIMLGDYDAMDLMGSMQDHRCRPPIILISGYYDSYLAMSAKVGKSKGLVVIDVLPKPIDIDVLENALMGAKDFTKQRHDDNA